MLRNAFLRALTVLTIAALFVVHSNSATAAPLQCGEDNLEDNDSCAQPRAISSPFSGAGLVVYKDIVDSDFYSITVPPGEEIKVDLFFDHDIADVDLFIYDRNGACGGLFVFLNSSSSSNDNEASTWTNSSASPVEVVVKVLVFPGDLNPCNTYDMQVVVAPPFDPCDPSVSDDALEENDDCTNPSPISTGTTTGLWVSRTDEDFYRVTVPAGMALDVELVFDDSRSDVDLFFYDQAGPCGGGFGTGELAAGFTQTDNERIIWNNTTGSSKNVIIHVNVFFGGNCNQYDMLVSVAQGGVGLNYCTAAPNSTGSASEIGASGSTSRSANNLRMSATGLPPNAFGFFLNSRDSGFTPNAGGSSGNLCLTGSVGRFDTQIQNTGGGGSLAITVNLGSIPQPNGAVSAMAGQTWHFQAWHRDSDPTGALTSNFTNGVRVVLTN